MRRFLGVAAVLASAALLSACSLMPGLPPVIFDDSGMKADDLMQQIADAVQHDDASALKNLFSPGARAKAADLDGDVAYFLSLFPTHRMTWKVGESGGVGNGGNDDAGSSSQSTHDYKAFAGDIVYDLSLDQVTDDSPHPEYVGLYALGVAPYSTHTFDASGAPKPFWLWSGQFGISDHIPTGTPGVYRPGMPGTIIQDVGMTPSVEMQHIADAVKDHDAAALRSLFSPRARGRAKDLDDGLSYFLSVLPAGPITWTPNGGGQCFLGGGYVDLGVANCSDYTVTAGGKVYALYFADYVVNQADPDSIGIYALGVAPYTTESGAAPGPPKEFTAWADEHQPDGEISGPVGVYRPQD